MGGVHNEIVYGANVDFREVWPPVGQMTVNGQLLIGSGVAPFIRSAVPTATDGSFTWTFGAGTIDGSLTQATTTQKGGLTLATNAETIAGSVTTKATTPDDIKAKLGAQTQHAVILGNGNTSALNASTIGVDGTVFIGNTGADPGFSSTIPGSITLQKANSGSDITFISDNTSNTANSTAQIACKVAGASAGDPFFTAIINGVTTWAWGADNSDSDAWVLAASSGLGSANVMRVATTGEITYPLQSCFSAVLGTNSTDVTGDGTTYIYGQNGVALTEIYDRNSDFSPGNGSSTPATYTAPVTGNVSLVCTALLQSVIAAMTCTLQIITSNRNYTFGNTGTSFTGNNPLLVSCLADMDAADIATFQLNVSGGTKIVDIYGPSSTDLRTYVQGWLLG